MSQKGLVGVGREMAAVGVGVGSWVSPISSAPVHDLPLPALCGHFLHVIPATSRIGHASLIVLYFNQHRYPS